MNRFLPALAAALLLQPPGATAQQGAPAPARAAAPPWQVDWGEYFCTMIRHPGEGRPYTAAFLAVPGADNSSLLLIPEARQPLPRGVTAAVLLPSGRSFDVNAEDQWRGNVRVLSLAGLPYELRSEMEGATELQLRAGAEVRLSIPLDHARAAVDQHRRCTAEISRQWGIDEARLTALRQRPTSTNRMGYRPEDYPAAALREAAQGRVILRVTVTTDGRAENCAVVATSGSRQIDATSCRVAVNNGRYRPAIDASGRPVTIPAVFVVTWRLPQRPNR